MKKSFIVLVSILEFISQLSAISPYCDIKIDLCTFSDIYRSYNEDINDNCKKAICLSCHPKSNPLNFQIYQDTSVTVDHLMSESTQGCNLSFDRTQSKMEIPFKCTFLNGHQFALDSIWVYDLVKGDSCLSFVRFVNGGYCKCSDAIFVSTHINDQTTICNLRDIENKCFRMKVAQDLSWWPLKVGANMVLCNFEGTADSPNLLTFMSGEGDYQISINASNCTINQGQSGIQVALFSDSMFQNSILCQTMGSTNVVIPSTNLITYSKYYLIIDGNANSLCDIKIDISGVYLPFSPLPLSCHNKTNPLQFIIKSDTTLNANSMNLRPWCSNLSFNRKIKIDNKEIDCSLFKGQPSVIDSFWVYDLVNGDSCLSYINFVNGGFCNCTHPDYAPLKALYYSTNGKDWTNNTGWKEGAEGKSCDPCNFNGVPWYGLQCINGRVTVLRFDDNNLNGNLPSSIGELQNLTTLSIFRNNLSGNIPLEISKLKNLRLLSFGFNNLTGSLPEDLDIIENLNVLDFRGNQLSGQIPSKYGKFKYLQSIVLSNNLLDGEIPMDITNLTFSFYIWLDGNNFSGCIKDEFKNLCNSDFRINNNPLLSWHGDFTRFCNGESQTGAPCDDGNPNTANDKIQQDCSCRGCISSTFVQSFSICKSENVTVGNSTYIMPGTYIDTLQSSTGCDSIITTTITQKPSTTFNQTLQICQGESVKVGTKVYNLPGTYVDTLQSFSGCDSIITTSLTVYPVRKVDEVIAICAGESHNVSTNVYTQSGNYIDTLQSIFGCDSIISTFLTVRPSQNISFSAPDKICKGTNVSLSVNAIGTYQWSNGRTTADISEILIENKTYLVTVTDQYGCMASSSISISVVEPKITAIPIADTLILCLKDTIIDPYSFLAQFDANGTWSLDEKNISGQPFNLIQLNEGIHTLNYGFFQQAPCPDKDTSFTLVVKNCSIMDCSFTLIDDSIRVNKNQATEISLTINDILPEEYIISIISVDPDVLESTNLSVEGLYSFTVTNDFGDIVQVVYEVCTPDCIDCKQASLWIESEKLKEIIRTNIIIPNSNGHNATLRFTSDDILKGSELYIFNRNGDRIYHMVDYDNSWNANGHPGGIYYYVLKYRGVDVKKTLTVIK